MKTVIAFSALVFFGLFALVSLFVALNAATLFTATAGLCATFCGLTFCGVSAGLLFARDYYGVEVE